MDSGDCCTCSQCQDEADEQPAAYRHGVDLFSLWWTFTGDKEVVLWDEVYGTYPRGVDPAT